MAKGKTKDKVGVYLKRGWHPVAWSHHPKEVKDKLRQIGMVPMMKECWRNSQHFFLQNKRYSFALSQLDYREGTANAIIPFPHAWLVWRGAVLDLTLPPDREYPVTYLGHQSFTVEEVRRAVLTTQSWQSVRFTLGLKFDTGKFAIGMWVQSKRGSPVGRVVGQLPEVIPGRGPRIRVNWGSKATIVEERNYVEVLNA